MERSTFEIRKISSEKGFPGDNGYGDAMQLLGKTRCPKCGSKIKIGVRDRIAVLSDKRVLVVGNIETLLHYDHPWVREYFHGPRARAAQNG